MPEIVEYFFPPWQLCPIVGGEPPQWEQIEKRTAGKQDDEQNRKQESRNGVTDDDDAGGPHVEARSVIDSFANTKRN